MMVLPESSAEVMSSPETLILPESPRIMPAGATGDSETGMRRMPGDGTEVLMMPEAGGPPTVCGPEDQGEAMSNPGSRCWATAEYLLWWLKDAPLPAPLVTTGTPDLVNGGGVLGRPSTVILFGGSPIQEPAQSGARVAAGYWLDEEHIFGIEGVFFFLAERSIANFQASSNLTGTPVLTSPVIDTMTQSESGSLISFPGAFAGAVAVTATSELWGAEANVASNLMQDDSWTVDVLSGFRYLQLHEDLTISRQRTVLPAGEDRFLGLPVFAGNSIGIVDEFNMRNRFYGWQVGAKAEYRYNRLSVDAYGKVALGGNSQTADIVGTTTLFPPAGTPSVAHGGLLALQPGIGHFTQNKFTMVPEFGVTAGWQVTGSLRAFVGYTFLYADEVARPGEQINRNVNPVNLPTSKFFALPNELPQPSFNFNTTNFWAQGFNVGVAFAY
jgi:hypothetical protein